MVGIEADADARRHLQLPGAKPQRRGERLRDPGRDALGALGIALRQQDDELVAAEPSQHVLRADLLAQALRELDQQLIAGSVAERVVDVLEMIDVEEGQRDVAAGRAGIDGRGDQVPQLRAVRQPGENVVIGEPRDLGASFLALDREGAEVDAGVDDAAVPVARRARFTEIEGEGGDDPAVLGLDRCRPAGAQAHFERTRLVGLPARIGVEIFGQHRFTVEGRGAAGSDIRDRSRCRPAHANSPRAGWARRADGSRPAAST